MNPPVLRRFCRVLLALNLGWCALGLTVGHGLPAWGMFSRVERLEFALTDGRGRPVDLYRYMPRGSYVLDQDILAEVVSFVCRAHPELRPLRLDAPALGRSGDPCPP